MSEKMSETIHATSIVIDGKAILLTGPSGSGKSDLALRLIDHGAMLLSDDYTLAQRDGDTLIARPPERIEGRMEVRGIGIVEMPHCPAAPVALILDLSAPPDRMPDALSSRMIAGMGVPVLPFAPFEASAPIKVALALDAFGLATGDHGAASAS